MEGQPIGIGSGGRKGTDGIGNGTEFSMARSARTGLVLGILWFRKCSVLVSWQTLPLSYRDYNIVINGSEYDMHSCHS